MTVAREADDRGLVLLGLARETLSAAFGAAPRSSETPTWLERPGASFVTLKLDDQLQGCIGSLEAYRPLAEDVRANSLAAAFHDPRFPPLEGSQLAEVRIEVSVLSALEPLSFVDEPDLLSRLRPGVDGLVLEHGGNRGTFLPAVWRQLPGRQEFLHQLKRKAGLASDFWAQGLSVSRYTVDSWAERHG